jgi:hypothetical protein
MDLSISCQGSFERVDCVNICLAPLATCLAGILCAESVSAAAAFSRHALMTWTCSGFGLGLLKRKPDAVFTYARTTAMSFFEGVALLVSDFVTSSTHSVSNSVSSSAAALCFLLLAIFGKLPEG